MGCACVCVFVCLSQLHGEMLSKNAGLSHQLRRLEDHQMEACKQLIQQTDRLTSISEYLRAAAL